MRGTANRNLPAFDKIDVRSAGFHADVAAAAQNSFHLAVNGFHAHGPGHINGIALDRSDGVTWGIVRTSGSGQKQRRRTYKSSGSQTQERAVMFAELVSIAHGTNTEFEGASYPNVARLLLQLQTCASNSRAPYTNTIVGRRRPNVNK